MSFEFFKSIVDRIDWPCAVLPFFLGESFLHPDFLKMAEYLNEKKQKWYVTSNLTVWREDVIREILKPGSSAYQFLVSIDGVLGTGNIEKTRPGTHEHLLVANINRLLSLKAELHSDVEIAFKLCERGQDQAEVDSFVQYWLARPELDHIIVGRIFKGDNDVGMRTHPCQNFDNAFMNIRWDGTLVLCTYNDRIVNGGELSYGVLNETDNLIDVYNNEKITRLRELQNTGIFQGPCEKCSFAYTGHGMRGKMAFRDNPGEEYWFIEDFYNKIWSKKLNWKPVEYYTTRESR
jgi:MoaA/NifB/PqqE/SkfB family radical SAM enzyme